MSCNPCLFQNLPTCDPLVAGQVWNNAGAPAVSTGPPPPPPPNGTLPAFVKQGRIIQIPQWLTDTGVLGKDGNPISIMFASPIDWTPYRSILPNLPTKRFSVYYSSDHSAGPGYIGRADADQILGPYIDYGAPILTIANQGETPCVVVDIANARVNLYVHVVSSAAATDGAQATKLYVGTDGTSFPTDKGFCFPYGHHTGYAQVLPPDATHTVWRAFHVLTGGSYPENAYSTSDTGEVFTFQQHLPMPQMHVVGTGKHCCADPSLYERDGATYMLTTVQSRPRYPATPVERVIAYPCDPVTFRPIGAQGFDLLQPGASSDLDYRLNNHYRVFVSDGTAYLFYDARSEGWSDGGIFVASAHATDTAQAWPFAYPVLADGELFRAPEETVIADWDATASDPPSTIVKVLTQGNDSSLLVPGVGYRISDGRFNVYGQEVVDPGAVETVEFTIEGLNRSLGDGGTILTGLYEQPSLSASSHALDLQWGTLGGQFRLRKNHTQIVSGLETGVMDYSLRWVRANPRTLTLRLSNYGTVCAVLLNGHTVYWRDIQADGMVWPVAVRPFLAVTADACWLTRWTMRVYS